jgi:hypothetical protein
MSNNCSALTATPDSWTPMDPLVFWALPRYHNLVFTRSLHASMGCCERTIARKLALIRTIWNKEDEQ